MAKQRAWGTDTYSKFDNLDSDSDDDDRSNRTATQFNLGEKDIVIKEVDYITPGGLSQQAKRVKELPQTPKEVWQVIVRKLRVWAASSKGAPEGDGAIPCRPYAVLLTCIFPDGTLLSKDINDPAEEYPKPAYVLRLLLRAMLNPLTGRQRRPGKVVFPDEGLAGDLYRSLERIGIEASQLSEADGIDATVSAYSNYLVKQDIARRAPTSERPGVLAGESMTPALGGALWDAAAKLAVEVPWTKIHERQCFRLRVEAPATIVDPKGRDVEVPGGLAWFAILGKECVRNMGNGDGTWGVGVFFSRLDLEARLTPPGHKAFRDTSHPVCSHTGRSAEDLGHDLKRTKPRKFDLRTGKELQFADTDALRAHWPGCKRHARPLTELEEGLDQGRKHWNHTELSVLFENQTILPFDDHDACQEHGWALAPDTSPLKRGRWPFTMEMYDGEPCRVSALNSVWLERACRAALFVGAHPELAKSNDEHEVELELKTTLGGAECVMLRSEPLYLEAEVNAAVEAKRKQLEEEAAAGGGGSRRDEEATVGDDTRGDASQSSPPTPAEDDALAGSKEESKDGGKCAIF